jgi:hypothetical protein
MTHTMLVYGDAARLEEVFEQLLRLAMHANLLSSDPSTVTSSEMHAACKILGVRCDSCDAAGFLTIACPTCGTLPHVEYDGPGGAYFKARDAWKALDKARATMSASELNKQFKQSAEGKAFQASSTAVSSGATSGTGKAITAEQCITYVRKHQNKMTVPLEPPKISYR